MTDEMATLLGIPEGGIERRQCVSLTLAAAIAWRDLGRRPTMVEAQVKAQELRVEQLRLALEARQAMGPSGSTEMVTAVEHELAVYVHDIVTAHHEKDFRSLAAFPVEELQAGRVVVLRSDYKGGLVVEAVTGVFLGGMDRLQPHLEGAHDAARAPSRLRHRAVPGTRGPGPYTLPGLRLLLPHTARPGAVGTWPDQLPIVPATLQESRVPGDLGAPSQLPSRGRHLRRRGRPE